MKVRDRRCSACWAGFNQCVRPLGHAEPHLMEPTGHECARAMPDPLFVLVERFLAKYDAVVCDEQYLGFMAMGWIHGGDYAGPTWTAELDALRAALTAARAEPITYYGRLVLEEDTAHERSMTGHFLLAVDQAEGGPT